MPIRLPQRCQGTWIACLVGCALFCATSSSAAFSQALFVSGGGLAASDLTEIERRVQPTAQVGAYVRYTDLFRLKAALTYQGPISAEGVLQLRPVNPSGRVTPYAFIGFGRYLSSQSDARSVVPAGFGVEYALDRRLSLNAEATNRWTVYQNEQGDLNIASGLMPTIGISYELFRDEPSPAPPEPEPEPEPPVVAEEQEEPEAEVNAAPDTNDNDSPDDAVDRRPVASMPADTSLKEVGEMVRIPDGTFIMGLTDEDPLSLQTAGRKRVTVSAFYLDKYEVSNEEYRAFLQELPPQEREAMLPDSTTWEETGNRYNWTEYFRSETYENYPVVGITYEQARRYCAVNGKRLPTEAEWEYAARGGQAGSIYPWPGYEPRDARGRYMANYNPERSGYAADGYPFTAPVDTFPPNAWGLYNVSGNVAEWVADAYAPTYAALADFNPLHENPEEPRRVVRGGSWASDAFYIGVGVRDAQPRSEPTPYVGCRCAMAVSKAEELEQQQQSSPAQQQSSP